MLTYIVSYDLNYGTPEEYADLYTALKAYGTWAKITESTWAIVTTDSAKEVRDSLGVHLHKGDRLFVVKSGVEAAWRNVKCRDEWLKEKL
jgi:uncharacterized Zn ribbon protein